ncbi:non-motor microtubule binding protein [Lithospermum erythrorhizon]|uniref:Non-motor microtubule binding protein n=1 Tax=Lithospermum erythrorhizon TaxID=34254 RepID=A0AAV3P639_LITER
MLSDEQCTIAIYISFIQLVYDWIDGHSSSTYWSITVTMATTCDSLLSELQKIWNEIGEPDTERDKMLFELERECLDAYRRKVDHANFHRAQLRQQVADSEAELAHICAALGVRPLLSTKNFGSLKEELEAIKPQLEEMQQRKNERKSQFVEVQSQINSILMELYGSNDRFSHVLIDENDLSLKRLEDFRNQLNELQKEKSDRLKLVVDHLNVLNSLSTVLGKDFKVTAREVHPTLDDYYGSKCIRMGTIQKLSTTIKELKVEKIQRMKKLQELGTTMVELWTLMDTPAVEQQMFQNVIRYIAASEDEISEENSLSIDFLQRAEAEVERLQKIKSIKIKEVLLKKRVELEEICRATHIVVGPRDSVDFSVETIEAGSADPVHLLGKIDTKISEVKEEALCRKEILEKVDKWFAACEEECWLEEFSRDDSRYNAGRGTHLMLKRAEKARALVNKIPVMVETLGSKVKSWEKEKGMEFLYDGVGLLSMLEQYNILREEKEQERQRQKDQKKLQAQLLAEQEARYGSKPSPSKSGKKTIRMSCGGASAKRFSMYETPHVEKATHSSWLMKKSGSVKRHQHTPRLKQSNGAFISSDKKDLSEIPGKQHRCDSLNPHESDISASRRPLSPLSSFSSNINSAANIQDQNQSNVESYEAAAVVKTPTATPTKNISVYEVNVTPKTVPDTMPVTPSTVSVAMQTAVTPATPGINRHVDNMEYSFEEKRAGFIPVKAHSNDPNPVPLPIV